MKRISIALAALLTSTTALAAIPSTEPTGVVVPKTPAYESSQTLAVRDGDAYAFTLHQAAMDQWTAAQPVARLADTKIQPTVQPASAVTWDDGAAEVEAEATTATTTTATATTYAGGEAVAVDLTPRAASQNYAACRPGEGDDNCIQLYEAGVEQRLASWRQPTGGFAGSGDTQVAMGGPESDDAPLADAEQIAATQEIVAHERLAMADASDAYDLTRQDSPTDDSGVVGL